MFKRFAVASFSVFSSCSIMVSWPEAGDQRWIIEQATQAQEAITALLALPPPSIPLVGVFMIEYRPENTQENCLRQLEEAEERLQELLATKNT